MKKSVWTTPLHFNAGKTLRTIGSALVRVLRLVWTGFNAVVAWLSDDLHWKGVKRLLAFLVIALLMLAVRYGWLANAKLDWLASLFSPLLEKEYPWSVKP